ncbi:MAG: hypothetical protein Q8M94_22750 [Ignavibacteria bacterium]|nr:hypothetical protein [Ignavibacteria bacterium]
MVTHEIGNTKGCNCQPCRDYADASEAAYLDMMARNERSAMTEW